MRLRIALALAVLACGSPAPAVVDAGVDSAIADASSADQSSDAGTCTDGVKDGAETDVDCGGPSCPTCKDGRACVTETDCVSLTCSAGICGTRAWSTESNGNNVLIAGNQTWVDASLNGLSLTPDLNAPSTVFLRWTGTLRFAGGGNGLCHVGQRFVIDDVPTGDPTWGNSIMVQNGTTRWHESFTTEMAVPLGLGLHTISVQMVDALNYGNCYLDGDDGAAYDRSRLAVSAYDPKSAWYAESNAEVSSLGGTFVDIPGLSVSTTLTAAQHVQVSMTGTQYVGGTTPGVGEGYCSYRLVIDGTPLGDTTYGQELAVGDVASGWWSPVSLKYGQDLTAGAHVIKAQLANPSTSATCYADQGNNPYARFRMFVSASPTGGPNVSVESTGGPTIEGSNSAWTDVGLTASFKVSAPTNAQLEMAATQETTTGTSGQCAWHFVIDGLPLGDVNNGQAVNVGSTATTWWTSSTLLWGQTFAAGSHTIGVEVRNSSTSGDCGTNGDVLPYGRARLLVRVP